MPHSPSATRRDLLVLLGCLLPVLAWSAWRPLDRFTWWLEVFPVFLGFGALFAVSGRFRFSRLALACAGLHMAILLVGGHYTYALVPLGEWAKSWFGWSRNHYDRIGHFAQGFVPAVLCREVVRKLDLIPRRGWAFFFVTCFVLALSAVYELIEWATAMGTGEAADAFLGTQGDPWDTQSDMAMALVGGLVAQWTVPWVSRFRPSVADGVFLVAVVSLAAPLAIGGPSGPTRPAGLLPGFAACAARARLLPLPAAVCAGVPLAAAWSSPFGTMGGAFCYNAQAFGDDNPLRGGRHLGDDLNGIGQENTDRGDPVFAAAAGWVAYAGFPSTGWGGVVILAHRLPEGGTVQTFYGHLEPSSVAVKAGSRVSRGRMVGRIGLPLAVDYAHLHLEVREGAAVDPGPGYASEPGGLTGRTSPGNFLGGRRSAAGLPDPGPPAQALPNGARP